MSLYCLYDDEKENFFEKQERYYQVVAYIDFVALTRASFQ